MKPYAVITICLFVFILTIPVSAKPAEAYGWNYLSRERSVTDGSDLKLLPEFSGRSEFLSSVRKSDPEVCLELLYTMPLPDSGTKGMDKLLFDALSDLSTLDGLEYYSSNKKKMTLYLKDCYPVKKERSKKEVSGPVFDTIPEKFNQVLYQKDVAFGSNWYSAEISNYSDYLRLSLTNLNTIKYLIIPAMKSGGLHIDLVIIPGRKNLQFYIVCQMDQKEVKVLSKSVYLPGFFDHRVSAYQGWFARRIYTKPEPGQL